MSPLVTFMVELSNKQRHNTKEGLFRDDARLF